MNVLVDTSVWSPALRRRQRSPSEASAVRHLEQLLAEARAVMIGPIRQELLSGLSDRAQFEVLRDRLEPFEDLELKRDHYEMAARFSNDCRRHGVQGSQVDFLICAAGRLHGVPVFTLDKDFERYRPHTGIKIHPYGR